MATAFSNTNFQFLFLRLKSYTKDKCLVPTDDTIKQPRGSQNWMQCPLFLLDRWTTVMVTVLTMQVLATQCVFFNNTMTYAMSWHFDHYHYIAVICLMKFNSSSCQQPWQCSTVHSPCAETASEPSQWSAVS